MTEPADGLKLFTDLEHVDHLLWEELQKRDPAQAAFRTGTVWDGEAFTVEMLGWTYRVDPAKETILCSDWERTGFQEGMVLLSYLGGQGPAGLAGSRVPLRNLPGGELFFAKTHNPSTDDLAEQLGLDAEGFMKAGEGMGARPTGIADGSWLVMALPQLPLEAFFFLGDSDFPSKITLIVDEAAANYLPLDGIWALVNLIRWRIKHSFLRG